MADCILQTIAMKGLSIILLARAAADAADISAINNKDTPNNNIDTRFQRALRWNWSFFNNNNNDNGDIQGVRDIDDDMTMNNGDIVEEIPWAGGFVLGDTNPPTIRPTKLPTKVSLNVYMEVVCLLDILYRNQI